MSIPGARRRLAALALLSGVAAGLAACGSQASRTAPRVADVAPGDVAAQAPAAVVKAAPKHTGPLTATHLHGRPDPRITDGTDPLRITLSAAPDPSAPRPQLRPAVRGSWSNEGSAEVFRPASTLAPCVSYTLSIPASTRALGHHKLGAAHTWHFSVSCPGAHAVQVALARTRYLPYRVIGRTGTALGGKEARGAAAQAAFHVTQRLERRYRRAPRLHVGSLDPMTKGALMSFQDGHGLTADGTPDAATWRVLLSAEANGSNRRDAYTWVTVTKRSPETLRVHRGGKIVLSTPANTGVPGADTPDGTFPIYSRLPSTTMIGTNVDGSKYNDPGVLWVNYFYLGDAVHAFERGSYGSPQSNGCVELPTPAAAKVYSQLHIGDLVVLSS